MTNRAAGRQTADTQVTVASPRVPISRELYTGNEAFARSARPGAYDALALPSRIGNRLVPYQPPVAVLAPALLQRSNAVQPFGEAETSATPPDALRPKLTKGGVPALAPLSPDRRGESVLPYYPRQGSAPQRVADWLRLHGGHLTYAQIAETFDVVPTSITAIFRSALLKNVLARLEVDGTRCMSLPGYVPPATKPAVVDLGADAMPTVQAIPAMATFGEVATQHKRLQETELAVRMWETHVQGLQARADFLRQLEQLRTHAPSIATPPFNSAA